MCTLVILDIFWVCFFCFFDRLYICKDALKIPFATSKAAHCYMNSCIFWGGMKGKSRGGQRARTVRCLHRQAKKKEREKEGERPPVCPLAFIVIPLMILQVGRNQCGLASAVLRSALCSSAQELWASLLPAAHRFSCDPEHGLPQRLTNFIHIFPILLRKPTWLVNPEPIVLHQ